MLVLLVLGIIYLIYTGVISDTTLENTLDNKEVKKDIKKENNKELLPIEKVIHSQERSNKDKSLNTVDIKKVDEMKSYLSPRERNLIYLLASKKDLTLEFLIKEYRKLRKVKKGQAFQEYEETTLNNIVYLLNIDKDQDEIKIATDQIIEEEAIYIKEHEKNLKQKQDKRVGEMIKSLKDKGALIYIETFIINRTRQLDMGKIDRNAYNEKINELASILEYEFSMDFSRKEIGQVIERLKDEVYKVDFDKKIDFSKSQSTNEKVQDYIKILGNQWDEAFYIKQLSLHLNCDEEVTRQRVEKVKREMILENENIRLKKELFGGEIGKNMEEIDLLSGYEFEYYLVELFSSLGYDVLPTSYSGDQGADLIIEDLGMKIVIQAKNYSGNVGNSAIQEALAAKYHYNCDLAMVITNSFFTKAACELAKSTKVVLINRDKLEEIIGNGKRSFLKCL